MVIKRLASEKEYAADDFLKKAETSIDLAFHPSVVLPGDDVTEIVTKSRKHVKLGKGLESDHERIRCINAGILRYRPPNRYWVQYDQKRYIAADNDSVIGVVTHRTADYYRLHIGSTSPAILPALAFDGASKRNRPNLAIGSLIYARVVKKGMEPELSCQAPQNVTRKEWMTGLSVYGELQNGYTFRVSIDSAKQLFREDAHILPILGRKLAYEIAVGCNGFVWVHSNSHRDTILISNAIMSSKAMTRQDQEALIQELEREFP